MIIDRETLTDRRGLKTLAGAFIAALLSMTLMDMLPSSLMLSLGLFPAIGLLFGPWGALGCSVASVVFRICTGVDLPLSMVTGFNSLMLAYIPYRVWYSTMQDVRPKVPVLGTSHNMAKVLIVMVVSSVIYTSIDHMSYMAIVGPEQVWIRNLYTLMSTLPTSIVLVMVCILVTGTLKMQHWTPRIKMERDALDRIDPKVFLVAGISIPVVMVLSGFNDATIVIGTVVVMALSVFVCIRPTMSVRQRDRPTYNASKRINTFDNQVNDRIIIIFNFLGLGILAAIMALFQAGLLSDIPLMMDLAYANEGFGGIPPEVLGADLSAYTYLTLAAIALSAVILFFLEFIERSVVDPMKSMARNTKDFVVSEAVMSADDMHDKCKPYLKRNDEIGDLARSIEKMARNVANYVKDIDSLTKDKQAYRAELAIARQIQMGLVPKDFDIVDGMGVRIDGVMEAAKYVGGDLYDFMILDGGKIALSVGDVSGKGVPAALFMSRTKALMEDHTVHRSNPAEVFTEVNNALAKENNQMLFVSSWLGIMDTYSGSIDFANAGHCPPLVWRYETKRAEYVEMEPCPVLGVVPDAEYRVESITLSPGDRIMIYTDGVTEANDSYEEFYGSDRLREVFEDTAGNTIGDQIKVIREDIKTFVGNAEQFDDITILVLEYEGRKRPSTGLRSLD